MENKLLKQPEAINLHVGAKGSATRDLQAYLQRFGYLQPKKVDKLAPWTKLAPRATPGLFDAATEHALAVFQENHGLAVTRKLDTETLGLINQSRCGAADRPYAGQLPAGYNGFSRGSDYWRTNRLSYRLREITPDISEADVRWAVSTALRTWSLVSPLGMV